MHDSTELPHEDFTVSYIVLYTKRLPLAEWRILNYGKKPDSDGYSVTFSYKEKGHPEVRWTASVEKFISLLIQYIPHQHFRVVHYYGVLASRIKPWFKRILKKLFHRMKQMTKFAHLKRTFNLFHRKRSSSLSYLPEGNALSWSCLLLQQIGLTCPLLPSVAIPTTLCQIE